MVIKMLKRKRGQLIFLGIMVFVIVFATAVQLIRPIKDQIILARNPDKLDCDNGSISFGQKSSCVLVDLGLPYFFATVLASAASYLTLKRAGGF
jgi:hypothetical protein